MSETITPTVYDKTALGGTKDLPRIHIPTWFAMKDVSDYTDALLNLDLISNNSFSATEDGSIYGDALIDLGGTNIISDSTNNIYKDTVAIGNTPPRQGSIIAYSDDNGTNLTGTYSAHVLYFEHAVLKSFNFIVPHNHVIKRIEKLYRFENETTISNPDTTYDMPDLTSKMMIINTSESSATVESGTTVLTLVEGSIYV